MRPLTEAAEREWLARREELMHRSCREIAAYEDSQREAFADRIVEERSTAESIERIAAAYEIGKSQAYRVLRQARRRRQVPLFPGWRPRR